MHRFIGIKSKGTQREKCVPLLLDKLEASNNYGIAVMKGENGELLDMINAGLANLKASGEYDAIIGTYIQD